MHGLSDRLWADMREPEQLLVAATAAAAVLDRRPSSLANLLCQSLAAGHQRQPIFAASRKFINLSQLLNTLIYIV